jgi:hypothetical protein
MSTTNFHNFSHNQHLQGTGEDMLGHMVPTEDKENVKKMHISSPNTSGVGFKKVVSGNP